VRPRGGVKVRRCRRGVVVGAADRGAAVRLDVDERRQVQLLGADRCASPRSDKLGRRRPVARGQGARRRRTGCERAGDLVLCYGSPARTTSGLGAQDDVETSRIPGEHEITCALDTVLRRRAPLTGAPRRLAELFRSGDAQRSAPRSEPAGVRSIETHGGTAIGAPRPRRRHRALHRHPPAARRSSSWARRAGHTTRTVPRERRQVDDAAMRWHPVADSRGGASPRPGSGVQDRRARDARGRCAHGSTSGTWSDDALALLRAWLASMDLSMTSASCCARSGG